MAAWSWAGSISSPDRLLVLPAREEGRCRSPTYLVLAVSVAVVAILIVVLRNHSVCEQAGEMAGVDGVAQENRPGHMEDFLHGTQIRRVREEHRAGKRHAVDVGVSVRGNHDLEQGVIAVVRVGTRGVRLGLVRPDDD